VTLSSTNLNRVTRRRTRGITLIEMVIVAVLFAVLIVSSSNAFLAALSYPQRQSAARDSRRRGIEFENRLRSWLENAYLSTVNTDANSFFIGGTVSTETTASVNTDGSSLIFTAMRPRLPNELLAQDLDFESLNATYGPETGMTEVSFSLTPFPDAPTDTGLFVRLQTPPDGDPTQGGTESLIDPDITSISFEFWDGSTWQTEWNTQSQQEPRLPAAVRVTYRREQDDQDRVLTVKLRSSDVSSLNPVFTTGGDTGQ